MIYVTYLGVYDHACDTFANKQVRLVVKLYAYGANFRPQRQDLVKKWSGQDLVKWRVATSKNLAIVSTLVATVAFSAAFNVPGSYGSDGKANLNENRMYTAFLVLDTIAVTTAVMATILLVYGRASQSNHSWWVSSSQCTSFGCPFLA